MDKIMINKILYKRLKATVIALYILFLIGTL
jgi:hypothetical protein